MSIFTRSFAAAVFLMGKGFTPTIEPSSVEPGFLVYAFPHSATDALDEYYAARKLLDSLASTSGLAARSKVAR